MIDVHVISHFLETIYGGFMHTLCQEYMLFSRNVIKDKGMEKGEAAASFNRFPGTVFHSNSIGWPFEWAQLALFLAVFSILRESADNQHSSCSHSEGILRGSLKKRDQGLVCIAEAKSLCEG